MSFLETDPRKLSLLLSHGTHEGELRKFFADSKLQLIQKGARVQNLPAGRDARIKTICERLPRKTDDVLLGWFQKNISLSAPMDVDEVLMHLESYFDEGTVPDSDAKNVCRSALIYLFADPPNEDILRQLRRAPGPLSSEQQDPGTPSAPHSGSASSEAAAIPSAVTTEPETGIPQSYQLSELIAAIFSEDESAIDNSLAPFNLHTRSLVECLLLIREGKTNEAREQLKLAQLEGTEADLVHSAIARSVHRHTASTEAARVRLETPRPADFIAEDDRYEIIGVYTNETPSGAIFVDPQIVVRDGSLWSLSLDDRLRLFPESGAVMTNRSHLRRQLRRGDLVHWMVAERDSADGRTRFHMIQELGSLARLVSIPVPSNDPDEVRDRIKKHSSISRDSTGNPTAFLLSDGVAIAAPQGVDFSRDESFDQPWHAWSSLTTWLIEGSQYCLDLPTHLASTLDLSTLDAAFRHLLRSLEAEQRLTLSRTQKRELSDLIRNQLGSEVSQRARRVAAALNEISIRDADLDAVMELLGTHRDVASRVEQLIATELEERRSEKAGIVAEIAGLKKKSTELKKEITELSRAIKSEAAATSGIVREAFQRAVQDGASTLANAEIFRLLSSGKGALSVQNDAPNETARNDLIWIREAALSDSDVKAHLSALGINSRQASILIAMYQVASAAGVALTIRGDAGRQCVETLARYNSERSAFVEIPMGLTSGELLRSQVRALMGVNALAVLNADLSPFEIYGGGLVDFLFESAVDGVANGKGVLLSCLGGPYSSPLPQSLRLFSLTLDLGSDWDSSERLADDLEADQFRLLRPLQKRAFESLELVNEDIREFVERALVRAMI